ncbi:MAG: hypothetical protein ACRECW_14825 [Phyllobacterium sp.]
MKKCILAATILCVAALAGCQSSTTSGPGALAHSSESAALTTMERVALAANTCWFKSRDASFRGYAMAPELNSFSGRPRFLVVPAKNPGARPLLVVQAEGDPAKVEAFGPMMHQPTGDRIASDIRRWADGKSGCNA